MKSLFLSLMLAMGATTATAQNYDYLILMDNQGTAHGMSVDGLKLTFEGGNLVATNGKETKTIALASMHKLYFSNDISSVGTVTNNDSSIEVSIVDGQLNVVAPEGSNIQVFGLDGRQVNAKKLDKGIYVVRVNNQTFKVISR